MDSHRPGTCAAMESAGAAAVNGAMENGTAGATGWENGTAGATGWENGAAGATGSDATLENGIAEATGSDATMEKGTGGNTADGHCAIRMTRAAQAEKGTPCKSHLEPKWLRLVLFAILGKS